MNINQNIKQYKVQEYSLNDIVFEMWGFLNHPLGGVYFSMCDKALGFSGERANLSEAELNRKGSMTICAVLGAFRNEQYSWLIREIIQKGGLGSLGGAHITCYDKKYPKENNRMYFSFDFGRPEYDQETSISYTDGIKLFHAFFNAYVKFVDDYAPELKNEHEYLGQDAQTDEAKYVDHPWYNDFLKELENLNKLYAELVTKGDIKE